VRVSHTSKQWGNLIDRPLCSTDRIFGGGDETTTMKQKATVCCVGVWDCEHTHTKDKSITHPLLTANDDDNDDVVLEKKKTKTGIAGRIEHNNHPTAADAPAAAAPFHFPSIQPTVA
jgi:hypothetical protein